MISVENIRRMSKDNGAKRFLIDLEWPRDVVRAIPHKEKSGQTRTALRLIEWRPQLAPSAVLWKWFHRDRDKVDRFQTRYFRELESKKRLWTAIAQASKDTDIRLLYHGRSPDLTPARFFKDFLERELGNRRIPAPHRRTFVSQAVRGVAPPVQKVISRKHKRPLRPETVLAPRQKRTRFPSQKRRIL